MAFFHSPNIVTSGLKLVLDAGNPKSYPGSGTTWTDLSSNGYNSTLTNGPTFNASNGGSIVFDGVDDYGTLNPSCIPTGNEISISFWNFGISAPASSIIAASYNSSDQTLNVHLPWSNSTIYWDCGSPFNRIQKEATNAEYQGWHHWVFIKNASTGYMYIYLDGSLWHSGTGLTSSIPAMNVARIGSYFNNQLYHNGRIAQCLIYSKVLSAAEVLQNYSATRQKFQYTYSEGNNAAPYVANWNNSTTYTMNQFGGLGKVNAHGFSSGPVTYTLTLSSLPVHTEVRYKVFWHLVDSLDNETNQLFTMNSSGGETEKLRFTKQYNLEPAISVQDSGVIAPWSGPQTYTYRPWANGYYGQDGYLSIDTGWYSHTANSFTARHVMGADQSQTDEAEYLSHVQVYLR